jgi:hypothetical protein
MCKADFYTRAGDEMSWVGSIFQHGQPSKIPAELLLKVNKMDYEESIVAFITSNNGVIDKWPWEYKDSRMTEYNYIFDIGAGKVFVSILGGGLLDPVKLYQGEDINSSVVAIEIPPFPIMKKPPKNVIDLQKRRRTNGFKSPKNV